MKKYSEKNSHYHDPSEWGTDWDEPNNAFLLDYTHIIFRKEDGKDGMKVCLRKIIDVWLERLEPEQQRTLELEEKTNSEKRELAILREEKERREDDAKRNQVQGMLKPFLREQILKVLKERGLEITKSNIRNLINECKEKSLYHSNTKYQYNPKGIIKELKGGD